MLACWGHPYSFECLTDTNRHGAKNRAAAPLPCAGTTRAITVLVATKNQRVQCSSQRPNNCFQTVAVSWRTPRLERDAAEHILFSLLMGQPCHRC